MKNNILIREKSSHNDTSAKIHEVHVNIWSLGLQNFLDVGIMFKNLNLEIIIDIPNTNNADLNMTDLGRLLSRQSIASAIFNERLQICTDSDSACKITRGKNKNITVVALNSSDFHNQKDVKNGATTITMTPRIIKHSGNLQVQNKSSEKKGLFYARFRIDNIAIEDFVSPFRHKDGNIVSSSTEFSFFDCRINNWRGIHEDILYRESDLAFPSGICVHLFFVSSKKNTPLLLDSKTKFRVLEDENTWVDYLKVDDLKSVVSISDYIAYHWRDDGNLNAVQQYYYISSSLLKNTVFTFFIISVAFVAAAAAAFPITWWIWFFPIAIIIIGIIGGPLKWFQHSSRKKQAIKTGY
jgi:hypothetical protein